MDRKGQKKITWWKILLVFSLLTIFPGIGEQQATAMTRTIQKEPAIVITAFGTTTDARATFDFFEKQLTTGLPDRFRNYKIAWAFTSEIVRERANKKFKEAGSDRRYLSLAQTLANLEDQGYRKIALQSLHIFPGQEYRDMEKVIRAFRQIGLRIEYGGTLLHEWPWLFEAVNELEKEFLAPDQGCNVLVAHGTPQTFPGSNSTYLGLDRYLSRKYSNVFVGGVDGVLTRDQALDQARAYPIGRVRFIPFMYVAGDHIMNDIMGSEADDNGLPSWAMELEQAGIKVDTVHASYRNKDFFKGLGFYEKINRMFIRQLVESLERLEKY
ncbi:MAG: sirohydrochlorin cobaltochelatase [Desulfobacterales bacterium]|nr:sirohydrochlorin cobaltochelatase [Desulfobacterales bacterium]